MTQDSMCVVCGSFICHRGSLVTVLVGHNWSHLFMEYPLTVLLSHWSGVQPGSNCDPSLYKSSVWFVGAVPVLQGSTDTCEPFLALAVRGPRAYSVLKDLTSSLDPLLFRKRGPLKPIHCGSQEPPLCYFPSAQVHRQLCLWFSGRVPGGSMQNGDQPLSRSVTTSLLQSDFRGIKACSPFITHAVHMNIHPHFCSVDLRKQSGTTCSV